MPILLRRRHHLGQLRPVRWPRDQQQRVAVGGVLVIDRELLVKALTARRREQARHEPELLLMAFTHNGEWAEHEADQLIYHMRGIQARGGR